MVVKEFKLGKHRGNFMYKFVVLFAILSLYITASV